jgi:hypothetical protein
MPMYFGAINLRHPLRRHFVIAVHVGFERRGERPDLLLLLLPIGVQCSFSVITPRYNSGTTPSFGSWNFDSMSKSVPFCLILVSR